MFQGFPTQKSKMSQEGGDEEEGSEVNLGLPCGREKTNAMNIIVERILLASRLGSPESIFCPATPVS